MFAFMREFSPPNRCTDQAEIRYVFFKYPGER